MSSKASAAIGATLFRSACARFATGITVVTTTDSGGHPHGLTINSFTSVSLEPPLVLVCIDKRNALLGHFLETAAYGINILADGQQHLSRQFSSTAEKRFAGVEWHRGELGIPLLADALATFECAVTESMTLGDHQVLVGEVRAATYRDGNPLLYFNSGYKTILGDAT